jgi:hypothetical protein
MPIPTMNPANLSDLESNTAEIPGELQKLLNVLHILNLQHAQNSRYCRQLSQVSA